MRRLLVAVGLVASMSDAFAGGREIPILRGTDGYAPAMATYYPWNGFYFGGQVGHSSAGADFSSGSVRELATFIVRNTSLESVVSDLTTSPLRKADTNSNSFGVFAGYNTQWEDVVLGVEVNYTHTSLSAGSADSQSVILSDDAGAPPGHHFVYDPLTVGGNASIRVTDLLMFRARAGWAAGQFLPYAFVAAGVARIDVSRSATVAFTRVDFPDPPNPALPTDNFGPVTRSEEKKGGFYFGYGGGLGVDIALMPNVFVRGEWEILQLPAVQGVGITINTLRVGGGLKF